MNIIPESKMQFDKAVDHLKHELTALRIGRATPAIVEDITVLAYGTKQQLKAVASITVQDAKTLIVEPWDKSILADVENGLRKSDLGINPINDGKLIRLPLPELTQERRQELIKVLHSKLEEARIAVRKTREEVRRQVETAEKNKEISEDEKFTQFDALEAMVKDYNEMIKMIGAEKEKDITTV